MMRTNHAELLADDENPCHYANMRVKRDLDDGVKVIYEEFGDLTAEVKAVTRGANDD
jgi:hypothetical protein